MRFITILLLVVVAGCTWVKLTPGGEQVNIANADAVTQCKSMGSTVVSLMDKVAGINRSREKVKKELETLARNSAAKMNANTVVAASEIEDGSQKFNVFVCE